MLFPHTKTTRDVDTVTFFQTTVPFPKVNLDDFLRQAALDIVTLLQRPPSTTTLSLQAGDSIQNAMLKLAAILHRTDDYPSPIIQQQKLQPPQRVTTTTPTPSSPRVVKTINTQPLTEK